MSVDMTDDDFLHLDHVGLEHLAEVSGYFRPSQQSRFQKAAALVREALEVAKNAYEEGGSDGKAFPWSMASANLAAENIEKALEALEKEA